MKMNVQKFDKFGHNFRKILEKHFVWTLKTRKWSRKKNMTDVFWTRWHKKKNANLHIKHSTNKIPLK